MRNVLCLSRVNTELRTLTKKKLKILLVNPAVFDFTAYDFWSKPYGMMRVAGRLRNVTDFLWFDYMDRSEHAALHPRCEKSDSWGRGRFYSQVAEKPDFLQDLPRKYRRFGLPRADFRRFLRESPPFEFAMIQTGMTYWYPGVREAIEDIRSFHPRAGIILGGGYATLCRSHAQSLGADLLIAGADLEPLWTYLGVQGEDRQTPYWDGYRHLPYGILKLAEGCPYRCTYCSSSIMQPRYAPVDADILQEEKDELLRRGVKNIAFYDDALLVNAEQTLIPFLERSLGREEKIQFHTPNALHARLINRSLASLLQRAGFHTFFLGAESSSEEWLSRSGGKVTPDDLLRAVEDLRSSGVPAGSITAYLLFGHPSLSVNKVEEAMYQINKLKVRIMLSEYSPVPGTSDGDACRDLVDMEEPLWHNKSVFPWRIYGWEEVKRIKDLCHRLNQTAAEG